MNLPRYNQAFNNEISILKNLRHSYIIRFLDYEILPNYLGIIYLEHQPFPTLDEYLQNISPLTETISVKVLLSLVSAVNYLHYHGISHQDIKPENMIYNFESHTIKLFDLGLAIMVDPFNPITSSTAGSPMYMAPEVYLKQIHDAFKSDVWSIGICFYEMLLGEPPFDNCFEEDEIMDEWKREKDISLPFFISSPIRVIYSQMVSYDVDRRISVERLSRRVVKILNKKCIGYSLKGSAENTEEQRSCSVHPAIRRLGLKF